jgi:hypothetical protein
LAALGLTPVEMALTWCPVRIEMPAAMRAREWCVPHDHPAQPKNELPHGCLPGANDLATTIVPLMRKPSYPVTQA